MSFRRRVVLLSGLAVAIAVAGVSVLTYVLVRDQLRGRVDAELRRDVPDSVTIDVSKEQRLHDALAPFFEQERDQHVGYIAEIEPQTARDLLGMTPSARHITPAEVSDDDLPERVTISVLVSSYRLRET